MYIFYSNFLKICACLGSTHKNFLKNLWSVNHKYTICCSIQTEETHNSKAKIKTKNILQKKDKFYRESTPVETETHSEMETQRDKETERAFVETGSQEEGQRSYRRKRDLQVGISAVSRLMDSKPTQIF